MKIGRVEFDEHRLAMMALLTAGFAWGTTGIFVRTLGELGLSVYEMLVVRLIVAGIAILPTLVWSRTRVARPAARPFDWFSARATALLGLSMVFYYLGAITAFHHLPLAVAALIIGSSPVLAWLLPLGLERRAPGAAERRQGLGVLLAIAGLVILVSARGHEAPKANTGLSILGYLGAAISAVVTVLNARYLNRFAREHGAHATPRPLEITFATVVIGLLLSPLAFSNFETALSAILRVSNAHPWPVFGFGVLATAIPGLAIAYASVRLPPQATATVAIQLQIWSGLLAWIILGESLNILQIAAAFFVVTGSWICVATRMNDRNYDENRRRFE